MRHGTWYSYSQMRCRCQECRDGARRRSKQYRLDKVRGVERLVDAQPLRDHVDTLRESGMSFRAIALGCGWASRNALADALSRDRVRPETLQRVLAVQPLSDRRGDRYVDATGSRRRLQALAYLGYPTRAIAVALGRLDPQTYQYVINGRTRTIRARTADDIRRLYDQWWDQPGPSGRTRTHARRMGYVPPMAWDDDDIDDPAARPDRWKRGRRDYLVPEDIAELLEMGETVIAIAARFQVTPDTVRQVELRYRRQQSEQAS